MKILYYACTTLVLLLCLSCTHMTREESREYKERRLMYMMEKQLNHDRIVADCQKYGNCKGSYKVYNVK